MAVRSVAVTLQSNPAVAEAPHGAYRISENEISGARDLGTIHAAFSSEPQPWSSGRGAVCLLPRPAQEPRLRHVRAHVRVCASRLRGDSLSEGRVEGNDPCRGGAHQHLGRCVISWVLPMILHICNFQLLIT